MKLERKSPALDCFLLPQRPGVTGRHGGGACVPAGLPALSSTCSSWAWSPFAASLSAGQKPKRPVESRF